MPFCRHDGLNLFYEEVGSGMPLILLHGFGQNGGAWVELIPILSRHYRIINLDMRGCGRSDVSVPGFTTKDLASDVIAVMDHIGIKHAHFHGWSLGGAVGVELGVGYSARLLSLGLHSTFAGGRTEYQRRWIEMRKRVVLSRDAELDFNTRIVGFFSPEFINSRPDRIEEFRRLEAANLFVSTESGLAGQNQAAQLHDARDRLYQISAPTLITVGSADRTTLPAASRYMHERIKDSEFLLFDNAGHFPVFQMPQEFATVLLGFSRKHDPVPGVS